MGKLTLNSLMGIWFALPLDIDVFLFSSSSSDYEPWIPFIQLVTFLDRLGMAKRSEERSLQAAGCREASLIWDEVKKVGGWASSPMIHFTDGITSGFQPHFRQNASSLLVQSILSSWYCPVCYWLRVESAISLRFLIWLRKSTVSAPWNMWQVRHACVVPSEFQTSMAAAVLKWQAPHLLIVWKMGATYHIYSKSIGLVDIFYGYILVMKKALSCYITGCYKQNCS